MDRIWRDARSIADLGGAMAGWLEGHIDSRPGFNNDRPSRPDEGTDPLVPVLARLNRRGWVTTDSQPGVETFGYADKWVQRAAVQGWIAADDPMLVRIVRAARAEGLFVSAYGHGRCVGPRGGFVATRRNDEPVTGFGGRQGAFWQHRELSGVGRRARRDLRRHGVLLAVVDPVWGRDDVLWAVLDKVCDYATVEAR